MDPGPVGIWNSLEIVKLFVLALTPVVIVGLTFWINSRLKAVDQRSRESDRVTQKRVELYDEIGIKANKIFAYIWYVGTWKETNPKEILDLKRELDTTIHTYQPWFSKGFYKCYRKFVSVAFDEYQCHGKDAKIRTTLRDRERFYPEQWASQWNELILDEAAGEIQEAYRSLLEGISIELGLDRNSLAPTI